MKKGFTLVELLTVIVVLGIIAAIVVPNVVDTIQNSRVKSCEEQVRMIENAAKRWGTENTFDLTIDKTVPKTIKVKTIKVSDLQGNGYLPKGEIINPVTKKSMTDRDITISYDENNHQYSYTLPDDICTK